MSVYHFGIEKNLWNALTGCETSVKSFSNSNDLKEYLLNKDYVSCSDVSFKFLGISLAGYNIILSFILLILSTTGFRKLKN
jgi:disulfide bond formation protein DsbB